MTPASILFESLPVVLTTWEAPTLEAIEITSRTEAKTGLSSDGFMSTGS